MRRVAFTIEHVSGAELLERLDSNVGISDYRYQAGSATIAMTESYDFWHTNSDLQTTIIVDSDGESGTHTELIVGGGAAGVFRLTFGSEKQILEQLAMELSDILDDLGVAADEVHQTGGMELDGLRETLLTGPDDRPGW